jgi:enolase
MNENAIKSITAREILDGRLEPTLRVTVRTLGDTSRRADVPCGRSRGKYEATDLRDGGERYAGRGVQTAVANIEDEIAPELHGRYVTDQAEIDELLRELDETEDKSRLGGNALTGVSLAVLKAGAAATEQPLYRYLGGIDTTDLPVPLFDLIEGGELGASGLTFQEHQVIPTGMDSFAKAIQACAEVYYELGNYLAAEYGEGALSVGDEGGYTPQTMSDPREAFDAELTAIEELGYNDVFDLGLDAAATHFHDSESGTYRLMGEDYTRGELIDFYEELADTYPLVSIEDPLEQDDFEGFAALSNRLDAQVVGDDLFVTDPERVKQGVETGAGDALLCKVNQVGTVSEAIEAVRTAERNGLAVQVSERSGQTADTWLADFTVGIGAGQIKTGVSRSERTEQYNRLLVIAADLGDQAGYTDWP